MKAFWGNSLSLATNNKKPLNEDRDKQSVGIRVSCLKRKRLSVSSRECAECMPSIWRSFTVFQCAVHLDFCIRSEAQYFGFTVQ